MANTSAKRFIMPAAKRGLDAPARSARLYHDIKIEPPEGFTPPTPPVEAALPGAVPAPSPFPEEVEAE